MGAHALREQLGLTPGVRNVPEGTLVTIGPLGVLMTVIGFLLGLVVTISRLGWGNDITTATIVLVALLLVSGTQFTLFAMWFDQEANKELR